VPIFLFALSGNAPAYSGIRVDGEFEDWSDSVIYSDSNAYSVAGLNIV